MPKSAKERKAEQREREAERLAALGHQVMQLEIYQGTAGGFEQPAEVITFLIHHADEIAKRDMSRFREMVAVPRST
ncbi:hypothetical protein [Pseudomonas oryzihabitans]|uniref:hypothetical protein n=1 Tax=Pseudomonas oryzihabitans TaxID=47885 RepID=UPI00289B606C|nr:hypothetical protein [Pseudomonas oryzihabitans]